MVATERLHFCVPSIDPAASVPKARSRGPDLVLSILGRHLLILTTLETKKLPDTCHW
jgi:hypothetical protein